MYCTQCGGELAASARYCSQCGESSGAAPGPGGSGGPKRLYRLPAESKIAGVCAGLSRYLGMDVTVVRLLFIALCFATGLLPLTIAYIIAWIIVPKIEAPAAPAAQPAPSPSV